MEEDIRSKKEGKEIKEKTAAEKEEEVAKRAQRSAQLEFELRAKLADGLNEESSASSSSDDEKSKAKKKEESRRQRLDDYDYSSGVESDNDVDLLVE